MKSCPICNNTNIIESNTVPYYFNFRACTDCGYFAATFVKRPKADYNEDLGRIKFICIEQPWGHVDIIANNFKTSYCIDIKDVDDFVNHLSNNGHIYERAILSYLNNNKIVKIDLLNYL